MKCVSCGQKTEIIETEKFDTVVWRRRRCMTCNARMNTHEVVVENTQNSRTKVRGAEPESRKTPVRREPPPPPPPPSPRIVDAITLKLSRQEERLFARLLEGEATTAELQQHLEIGNVSQAAAKINAKMKFVGDKRHISCEMKPYENPFGELTRIGYWRIGDGLPKPARQRIQELRDAREIGLMEEY